MLNRLEVIGNLGRDPEMNYTPAGKAVTKFSVAVNERHGSGENRTETTMWLNVVAWERLGETCNTYLHKGSKVYLAGRLAVRDFTRQDGSKGTAIDLVLTDMVMLDGKPANGAPASDAPADDIPF